MLRTLSTCGSRDRRRRDRRGELGVDLVDPCSPRLRVPRSRCTLVPVDLGHQPEEEQVRHGLGRRRQRGRERRTGRARGRSAHLSQWNETSGRRAAARRACRSCARLPTARRRARRRLDGARPRHRPRRGPSASGERAAGRAHATTKSPKGIHVSTTRGEASASSVHASCSISPLAVAAPRLAASPLAACHARPSLEDPESDGWQAVTALRRTSKRPPVNRRYVSPAAARGDLHSRAGISKRDRFVVSAIGTAPDHAHDLRAHRRRGGGAEL